MKQARNQSQTCNGKSYFGYITILITTLILPWSNNKSHQEHSRLQAKKQVHWKKQTFSLYCISLVGSSSISSRASSSVIINCGSFVLITAWRTASLCFLFFFSSRRLASFLAWSVGFMNFPPLVVEVARRPMLHVSQTNRFTISLTLARLNMAKIQVRHNAHFKARSSCQASI